MRGVCLLFLISVLSRASSETGATAADAVDVVMRSLQSGQGDADTAQELAKLRLRERLDDETVAYLASRHPGPRTLAAIENLCKRSAGLPGAAQKPVTMTPAPSQAETRQILANVSGYASHYVHGLPDFTCTKVTRRYSNINLRRRGKTQSSYQERLHYYDTLQQGMQFVHGHDSTRDLRHPAPGESISAGEFGGDMDMILGSPSVILVWNCWEHFAGAGLLFSATSCLKRSQNISWYFVVYKLLVSRELNSATGPLSRASFMLSRIRGWSFGSQSTQYRYPMSSLSKRVEL